MPTVAGHSPGVDKAVNHADCVASMQDHIVSHDLSGIVLLGDSFGDTVIARVF